MTPDGIALGDTVRWWPDGLDTDGQALIDRYIDGTVTSHRDPLCIRITGSHGFTGRARDVGSVVDTSVRRGTIRRLNEQGLEAWVPDSAPVYAPTVPVLVGRIVGYHSGHSWVTLDRVPALQAGDIVCVKYHADHDVALRTGEITVKGVMGAAVHFEVPPYVSIPAIVELDWMYLVRRAEPKPARPDATLSAKLGYLKHGPGGSGLAGPCDPGCLKCVEERWTRAYQALANEQSKASTPKPDPLDVKYDNVTLRQLLNVSELVQREAPIADQPIWFRIDDGFTPAQRAAVSAHWSAALRAKIAASQAAALQSDRNRISCDPRDPIDLED